jgi:hypothetical protein
MYKASEVNKHTRFIYHGTERSFDEFNHAIDYALTKFKADFGEEAVTEVEFWDPINEEESTQIFSVEIFPPNGEDGMYIYKDWNMIH